MAVVFCFFVPIVSLALYVLIPLGYFFEGAIADIDKGYITAGE